MKNSESGQLAIAELAAQTGISAHTLRYYERVGLMTEVPRSANGRRVYDESHVHWVEMLRRLRAVGMPISLMAEYVEMARRGPDTLGDRVELLERHRSELELRVRESEEFLEILRRKIQLHRDGDEGADCLVSNEVA